jgi:hypothetical protein
MSMSVSASSNALSYLQQLLQQGIAGASGQASASDPLTTLMNAMSASDGSADQSGSASDSSSAISFPPPSFDSNTMAMLISTQSQSASSSAAASPSQSATQTGSEVFENIGKTDFENALAGAGVSKSDADTLFAQLDSNGTSAAQGASPGAHGAHGQHHHGNGGGAESQDSGAAPSQNPPDALLSGASADGATSQTATNADGSTTTTLTYADGTKIDMISPAAASNAATSSSGSDQKGNLIENLIRLQSQLLPAAAATLSTIA